MRLGQHRMPGTDLVEVIDTKGGAPVEGAAVTLLVVTDDRPFLVDTATARVTELGWTLRGVWHPILGVARDASGTLVDAATTRTLKETRP